MTNSKALSPTLFSGDEEEDEATDIKRLPTD